MCTERCTEVWGVSGGRILPGKSAWNGTGSSGEKEKTGTAKRRKNLFWILRDGERVAIRKRPAKGLLAGMYELPNLEGYLSEEEILSWVENQDLIPLQIVPLIDAKRIFSHVEWDMKGYLIRVAALEESADPKMIFAEISEVEKEYPIPAGFSGICRTDSDASGTG